MSELTRLGKNMEAALSTRHVIDATTRPTHIDSKSRREMQEKRIALGHKPDDHEDEPQWLQQM